MLEIKMKETWQPHEKHGQLTKRSDLPDSVFAFPKQRKEPLRTQTTSETPLRVLIKQSTFQTKIASQPLPTSGRPRNPMAST